MISSVKWFLLKLTGQNIGSVRMTLVRIAVSLGFVSCTMLVTPVTANFAMLIRQNNSIEQIHPEKLIVAQPDRKFLTFLKLSSFSYSLELNSAHHLQSVESSARSIFTLYSIRTRVFQMASSFQIFRLKFCIHF